MQNPPKRFTYLLTMWQERPASPARPAVWRFSVEDTCTRQRRGFGDLEDLLAFLQVQVETNGDPHGQGGET